MGYVTALGHRGNEQKPFLLVVVLSLVGLAGLPFPTPQQCRALSAVVLSVAGAALQLQGTGEDLPIRRCPIIRSLQCPDSASPEAWTRVLNFVYQKISDIAEITEFREISVEIYF